MRLHSCFLLLLISLPSFCQVSALQSKSGETSILIPSGGISINTSDSKISAAFSFGKGDGKTIFSYGITTSFKSTEGITSIFEGRLFKAQFDINPFLMWTFGDVEDPSAGVNQLYVLGGYKRAKLNILQNSSSTEFDAKTFDGLSFTTGYNLFAPLQSLKSKFLVGASVAILKRNNVDIILKPVDRYVLNTTQVGNAVVAKEKKGGYEGEYISSLGLRLNLDGYIFPPIGEKENIGIGGFARIFGGKQFSSSSVGTGIIIGNPLGNDTVVFGLFYQLNHYSRQSLNDKRRTLTMTAGYNF